VVFGAIIAQKNCPDRGTFVGASNTPRKRSSAKRTLLVVAAGRLTAGARDKESEAKGQRLLHSRPPIGSAVARYPSAQDKSSGRRLDASAVVSAIPTMKAKARVMAIFFMAISLFIVFEVARTGQGHP
jgi:hypothetical protein